MQQIQYYKSAWGDIKNSPGWFGKLCLLALVNFIPVFGQIVSLGYIYGWAREIAWGTHEPMPARIFGNDDGKLYRRGWFVLVLTFVASLVPGIVLGIGSSMQGAGLWGIAANSHAVASSLVSGLGLLVYLVGLVGLLFLMILAWIGSMRISIYDRLSAGFQIGKIWKMFRRDTNGVMRIFGMYLLVGLIIVIVLSIIASILVFLVVFAGIASLAASGYNIAALQHLTDSQAAALVLQVFAGAGVVGFFSMLVIAFLAYVAEMFVMLLVVRAMGYWTMQFDVPRWRGQDDPMPFEVMAPAAAAMPVNPVPPAAQQPYQQPYGAYAQQQPMQPVQPAAPEQPAASAVAPVVPFEPAEPETVPEPEAAAVPEVAEQPEAAVELQSEAAPEEAATAVEPGQLSGFTYTGASGAQAPVTPSGADPSADTVPDLLVVLPDEPESASDSAGEQS